jgi:hypothetical protein
MPVTVTVGAARTVSVCAAASALFPADELTTPGVLRNVPGVAATTSIVIEQFAAAANEPPVSEKTEVPGVAVITPAEPQVPLSPLGLSIVKPTGSVSVKPRDESLAVGLGLVIVTDRALAVDSPTPISGGVKALVTVGGAGGVAASAGPLVASAAVPTAASATSPATRRRRCGLRRKTAELPVLLIKMYPPPVSQLV